MKSIHFEFALQSKNVADIICRQFILSYADIFPNYHSTHGDKVSNSRVFVTWTDGLPTYILNVICETVEQINAVLETFYGSTEVTDAVHCLPVSEFR